MAKRSRTTRSPLILFGEGPTEELFLGHIKQLYSQHLANKSIKLGNGGGGSPGSILLALEKKYLNVGDASTPTLMLIDADQRLDREAKVLLEKYTNIQVVFSRPECLEGLLLDLLDDLPPVGQQSSERLKKRFQDEYLGTRAHVQKNFKLKRSVLFPKVLLDSKLSDVSAIQRIYEFLGIIKL